MKKLILGLVAATVVAAPLAMSAPANAATANSDGSVTVTKGDIQSAMGWNNAAWDSHIEIDGVNGVGSLITTSGVATPVDVPGGWLTLNGQIVADYPSDEYYSNSWTNPENWGPNATPVSSYWTTDGGTIQVTPTYGGSKLNGLKVTVPTPNSDGYVYYTRHTTYTNPDHNGATYVYHATSRWPASVAGSGVSNLKVNGKPVTVTPYVAPAA